MFVFVSLAFRTLSSLFVLSSAAAAGSDRERLPADDAVALWSSCPVFLPFRLSCWLLCVLLCLLLVCCLLCWSGVCACGAFLFYFTFFPLFSCCLRPWLRVHDADLVRGALWGVGEVCALLQVQGRVAGGVNRTREGEECWVALKQSQKAKHKAQGVSGQSNSWTQSVIFSRSERSVGLFVDWAFLTAHPSLLPLLPPSSHHRVHSSWSCSCPSLDPAHRIRFSRDHGTARTAQRQRGDDIAQGPRDCVIFCETVQNTKPLGNTKDKEKRGPVSSSSSEVEDIEFRGRVGDCHQRSRIEKKRRKKKVDRKRGETRL